MKERDLWLGPEQDGSCSYWKTSKREEGTKKNLKKIVGGYNKRLKDFFSLVCMNRNNSTRKRFVCGLNGLLGEFTGSFYATLSQYFLGTNTRTLVCSISVNEGIFLTQPVFIFTRSMLSLMLTALRYTPFVGVLMAGLKLFIVLSQINLQLINIEFCILQVITWLDKIYEKYLKRSSSCDKIKSSSTELRAPFIKLESISR